jgi:hypothetical protein
MNVCIINEKCCPFLFLQKNNIEAPSMPAMMQCQQSFAEGKFAVVRLSSLVNLS